MPFVRIADRSDFDASLIGHPLERLGLSVEVEVVAAGVTDVDGELIGLKIGAQDQVGGIGADNLGRHGISLAENRLHEPFRAYSHEAGIEVPITSLGSYVVFQR